MEDIKNLEDQKIEAREELQQHEAKAEDFRL